MSKIADCLGTHPAFRIDATVCVPKKRGVIHG